MNYDVGVITSRLLISPEPFFGVPTAAAAEAWYTLSSISVTADFPGFSGYTIRQAFPVAGYAGPAPATGTKLRVTIKGGIGDGAIWDKMYVGHAAPSGDAIDFDGTQVQLLFSGSASGSVAAGSVTLVSDAVNYAFDKTKALVISIHCSGATTLPTDIVTGYTRNYQAGDSAATTDVTGGTTTSDRGIAFPLVEVFG